MRLPLNVFVILTAIFLMFMFAQDGKAIPKPTENDSVIKSPESQQPGIHKKEKPDSNEGFYLLNVDKLSGVFFVRLVINLISVTLLIRMIYFRRYRRKELFFTFFIFNFTIFLITYLLNKVDMGLGAAFGLFAVFSMLRYRTENIDTKDMTYLFLCIALGLITAIARASALELCILTGSMLTVTFLLESGLFLKKESSKIIQYEHIEMIKPENYTRLLNDLQTRTGLNIHRVAIGKIDFIRDMALITIYYSETDPASRISAE
ncbi:MAG TPA: DUF4956 domain-containing protein [Bacteroidia bacterium]|jgi:hypothetical protein|nr:DUF4956 domain-containing protein [Bacteroidia bacterium]